jgi:hypothetical protein
MMRFIATSVDARVFQTHWQKPLFYYVDSDFLPNYGTSYDNRRSTTGCCSWVYAKPIPFPIRANKPIPFIGNAWAYWKNAS